MRLIHLDWSWIPDYELQQWKEWEYEMSSASKSFVIDFDSKWFFKQIIKSKQMHEKLREDFEASKNAKKMTFDAYKKTPEFNGLALSIMDEYSYREEICIEVWDTEIDLHAYLMEKVSKYGIKDYEWINSSNLQIV